MSEKVKIENWLGKEEFSAFEAAFLFCELEPVRESSSSQIAAPPLDQVPQSVLSIARELERDGVPYEPMFKALNAQKGRLYKRDDLIGFANKKGYRPKFLFPDMESVIPEKPIDSRERNNLQRAIAMLVLMLADNNSDYYHGGKPNAAAIVRDLVSTAEDLGVATHGLKSLDEKIPKWLAECQSHKTNPNKG